jgi:cytochrome c-type biogenesis protein
MSLIPPEIANPYFAVFTLGIGYGLVFCTSSCLPYIASYIAGIGAGFKRGTLVTLTFNLGRVTAYAVIGGLAALFSGAVGWLVNAEAVTPFQQYSSYFFGAVTIIIGVSVLLKARKTPSCDCNLKELKVADKSAKLFDFKAFSLGLSRGLVLCVPLAGVLVYAVAYASPFDAVVLAVLFGLGTTISPLLLLGGATGWLLNKAPLLRKWISIGGAGVLIVLGAGTLLSALTVANS